MLARRRPAVPGLRVVYTARRCAHFSALCTPPSRSFSADAQVDELARSAHIAASCTQRGLAYTTPRSAHNARQSRGIKQGRRPIAPPRLICTLESPVSSTSRSDNCDSMFGPAPTLPSSTHTDERIGRRWRVRSPEATGSRSHGRRVQTLLSLLCSLDSPPSLVALWVATMFSVTLLFPPRVLPYSTLFSPSANGSEMPADGTNPTSRARRSASSRLECTPSRS